MRTNSRLFRLRPLSALCRGQRRSPLSFSSRKSLWALALPALLAGCALGPDYKRPEMVVPTEYRWQDQSATGSEFGDLQWWEVYRDPQLWAILKVALQENLDVRIAAARVEQARAALGSSRLQFLPTISGEAGVTRQRTSEYARLLPDQPAIGESDTAAVNASYELDIWGRLRRLNEASRAQFLGSQYAQQGVMVGLIADVATTYFNLITLDEQLAITRNTMETRQKFVDLTHAKHKGGVISGLDVSTAESELATARANVPEIERQAALAEDRLSILLGKNPGDIVRSGVTARAELSLPQPPTGLPSSLLERRPDIRRAEQDLVAANAQVGAAKAALFPTISLTGSLGSRSNELSNLFKGPARTWTAGAGLALPLIDAQNNLYQLDLADARKREVLLTYQQAVQNAFREVADALIARQKYVEFLAAQQDKVDALRRADNIAMARYKVGYSSYFDVINSNRDLFNAELALSSAQLNALLANVQLYQALGGGWAAGKTASTADGVGQ
ncbi:MAG: outer membrane protein multidrug efflux system [Verrucomicrobiaceae bacterium]|nr:outer membrane protein multidrug efflux system [Verrucomicrobiaceae bacterium]